MGQPYSTQRITDSLKGAVDKCLHDFQTRKTIHVCKIGDICHSNFEWAAEFSNGDDDYVFGSLQYILDSGATVHCFNDLTLFHSIDPNAQIPNLRVANGAFSKVVAVGTVRISLQDSQGKPKILELKNALYVPSMKFNLISVKRMYRDSKMLLIMYVSYTTCYQVDRWKTRFHRTNNYLNVSLIFQDSECGDVNAIFI